MSTLHRLPIVAALALSASCTSTGEGRPSRPETAVQKEAQAFLDRYNQRYRELATASSEADWASQTRIVEGDETNSNRLKAANEASAAYTGSVENIETARAWLKRAKELTPLQQKQFEAVLFKAASNPQTIPDLVKQRIAAEAKQTETLYGYTFHLDGKEITPNELDDALRTEKDLAKRRKVWEASKDVGKVLKPGLVELQKLRNQTVQALGYPDFFSYMVSEYGMTTDEMAAKVEQFNRELRPVFKELHTWARYELAKRYGQPVPDQIPADWLPNRWGQGWDALVDVPGFDLDAAVAKKGPVWVIEQAERFYVSLGFTSLPKSFWEKSSLYPVAKDAGYKKNTHASAWHIDLDQDVRSLMSVEPNQEWYETTHHELGHIYYYLSYTNPKVPPLLREGANRAYHEAVGSLMGLAAMQPRFIRTVGLDVGEVKADPMQLLLKEALNYVVFIPWSTGTMFSFEKELYHDNLPPAKWNARWWELAQKYQGIVPPTKRGEELCDAATKTHINDDPAGYYDYALSFVLLFQLHDHIAKELLHEDPHDTNYFGKKDVGAFLASIMTPGASADWRKLLKDKTGSDLSAKAMVDYFEPLRKWLVVQNKGRKYTLAEI
ncbi:MAG: M2 family metallopeptidase [Planctomycetes bacterium]|nr:M2 family metallopeptidase [Planctomycetota bacterium]